MTDSFLIYKPYTSVAITLRPGLRPSLSSQNMGLSFYMHQLSSDDKLVNGFNATIDVI